MTPIKSDRLSASFACLIVACAFVSFFDPVTAAIAALITCTVYLVVR